MVGKARAHTCALFGALVSVLLAACSYTNANRLSTPRAEAANAQFETDVRTLADALTIPSVAYAVVQNGEIIAQGEISTGGGEAVTIETPLRFASVTKAVTAVALMRAVERGRIALDDSASAWLPQFTDRPDITLRQLAAHVSEGAPGTEYVYGTNRYAMLGPILTNVLGAESFAALLRREVLAPAGMQWRDSPHLGAHAGLISTVADMALLVGALQRGELLSEQSFDSMIAPYRDANAETLPVGVGWFSQVVGGERIAWSFGQDDPDHSSALIMLLPDRDLGLVMLANTDELSNPFRLLMGNVRTSPFAVAFLDAFASELGADVSARERLINQALVAAWREDREQARVHLGAIAALEPRPSGNDFALHYLVANEIGDEAPEFAAEVDRAVVDAHPANRWALLMSASINARQGHDAVAVQRFEAILALPNQEQDFLASLFRVWSYEGLAQIFKEPDPERALRYIDLGLATGIRGEARERLEQLRAELSR